MTDSEGHRSPRRPRWRLALLVGTIVLVAVGAILWWVNRPIEPVNLSEGEQDALEVKMATMQRPEPVYERGVREIVLTERELNGLLHRQTGLGDRLKFELGTDAVHARLEMDLDENLPLVGGRRLKARSRFTLQEGANGLSLVMEDVTVWGISLPNEWLGGWKGRDLLRETLGGELAGVEGLRVVPGEVKIELKE